MNALREDRMKLIPEGDGEVRNPGDWGLMIDTFLIFGIPSMRGIPDFVKVEILGISTYLGV